MKPFFFITILSCLSGTLNAQIIPKFSVNKDTAKTTKPPSPKPKTSAVEKPAATIKFLSDADASLYIDGERKGTLQKDIPLRITLGRGQYIVKAVSAGNTNDFINWDYTVTETGIEKIEKISLQSVIDQKTKNTTALKSPTNIEMISVGNFTIGKYEVTQAQWQAVMGNNPSNFKGNNLPVEQVSWNDAQEFIQKLNNLTGKQYRLPTEKEWEYAANGGSQSRGYEYSGSNDINSVAWYSVNSGSTTHIVGQKQPNELGIYDMTGNVWEWCSDWYDNSQQSRVKRGGCWIDRPDFNRTAYRYGITPNRRDTYMGFRLAMSL